MIACIIFGALSFYLLEKALRKLLNIKTDSRRCVPSLVPSKLTIRKANVEQQLVGVAHGS